MKLDKNQRIIYGKTSVENERAKKCEEIKLASITSKIRQGCQLRLCSAVTRSQHYILSIN